MQQIDFMQRCLQLAEMGLGKVAPNPMVGAVLVYEGRIIGEGYHMQYGQAHAEVNCINSVQQQDHELISKSTLYVSLEPCNHHGKTPPCTDLILQYKIPRVVVGCQDPFSLVNGAGFQRLKSSGVEVQISPLEKEVAEINKRFFTFHHKQRPYIILKWAETADGYIAPGNGQRMKISGTITDKLVHKWRSEESAIMVGTNTALTDNPSLTTRHWKGADPVRIVIDWELKIPPSNHLLDGKVFTIVINHHREEKNDHIHYFIIANKADLIPSLNRLLYQMKLLSLIVEGGTILLQSFINAGCWDEARVIRNSVMELKQGLAAPSLRNVVSVKVEKITNDHIHYYKNAFE